MARAKRMRAKKRLVLDLGSSAVRVCELTQTKTGFQLTNYHQREFAIDPAMDDAEKKEIRLNTVKDLLKEAKIRSKKTILAVQGQSVFTRNRDLPPVPEFKVTQIVRYEIQQQIPFSLDQIALDYQVLNRTEAGGYSVMMAAIKVDVVEKNLEILKDIKRSIDAVDVSPIAAYNWLKHTGEFGEEGECVALLDLGATTTDIVIERDNQFRFTRSLNVGGNNITAAIASSFNMSYLEAEKLKRERGFAPTGDPQRDGKGGEVIGQVLNRLVTEVNRSFAYFRSQTGGGTVNRVIITGGGACLRNIIPFLQRQLGVEVRIAQPLAGLVTGPGAQQANEYPEQSAVVLGLALRCVDSVPIEINLIPPRIQESARRREQFVYWIMSFCTLALIMGTIIPISAEKDEQVRKQIEKLENVLGQYDKALVRSPEAPSEYESQLDEATSQVQTFEKRLKQLDNARSQRRFWLAEVKAVVDARPRSGGIWITGIETSVIGGPANTGDEGRAKMKKDGGDKTGAADAADEAPPPQKKEPPAAKKTGLGAFALNVGALGGAPGGAAKSFNSSGFPGIAPMGMAADAGGGFGGGMQFSLSGGITGGNRPAKNKPKKAAAAPPVTEPNALVVVGYAESLDTLQEFQKNLTESDAFIDGGVYFHESRVKEVSYYAIDEPDPSLAAPIGVAGGGTRQRSGGSSGGGGGGIFDISAISTTQATPQYNQPSYNEPQVYSFRFDLQFLGAPIAKPM